MVEVLKCSSMTHVIDRAISFRFCRNPYECIGVFPNGVLLLRKKDDSCPEFMLRIEVEIPS